MRRAGHPAAATTRGVPPRVLQTPRWARGRQFPALQAPSPRNGRARRSRGPPRRARQASREGTWQRVGTSSLGSGTVRGSGRDAETREAPRELEGRAGAGGRGRGRGRGGGGAGPGCARAARGARGELRPETLGALGTGRAAVRARNRRRRLLLLPSRLGPVRPAAGAMGTR